MKLRPIAANQTEVTFNNGARVLFSYETPVAAWDPLGGCYLKTEQHYSATTTRHINAWIGPGYMDVPQSEIDDLVGSK